MKDSGSHSLIKAMSGRDDPSLADESTTTLIQTVFVNGNLPRPATHGATGTPDDPRRARRSIFDVNSIG